MQKKKKNDVKIMYKRKGKEKNTNKLLHEVSLTELPRVHNIFMGDEWIYLSEEFGI